MSFEAVFVPGLAEKLFPRKIVEERSLRGAVSGGVPSGLASGTCPSERYSANRLAERFSAAQQSSA
jgi:hypothetical protein